MQVGRKAESMMMNGAMGSHKRWKGGLMSSNDGPDAAIQTSKHKVINRG